METFKIIKDSIKPDGSLSVVFSVDGKTQNLSQMPIDDEKKLEARLNEYAEEYVRGLKQFPLVEIKAEVKAMENKEIALKTVSVTEGTVIKK
jgi:hypothetical protein